MDVRPANAAGGDADEHVTWPDLRIRNIAHANRTRLLDDDCFHG
jgi:hypothetical protein